jgi:hypothetical protein
MASKINLIKVFIIIEYKLIYSNFLDAQNNYEMEVTQQQIKNYHINIDDDGM